jgi:hypothetical protein
MGTAAHAHTWIAASLAGVALLMLIADAPHQTADRLPSFVMSGFVLGILFGLGIPLPARRHRSDWPFVLAVGVLFFATFVATYAGAGAIAAVLPRPDGQSIMAALIHAIAPAVDVESLVFVLVVVFLAAALVVAVLGRAAYGRQGAPTIGP